jgi:aconitate hydratase
MGVLPCKFLDGQNAQSLGLTGREIFDFEGIGDGTGKRLKVTATAEDGSVKQFEVRVLLETPKEVEYFRHGGILPYVLRQLAA